MADLQEQSAVTSSSGSSNGKGENQDVLNEKVKNPENASMPLLKAAGREGGISEK